MTVLQKGIGRDGNAGKFTGIVWSNGEFGLCVQRKFRVSFQRQQQGGEGITWTIQRPTMPWLPETNRGPVKREMETHEVRLAVQSRSPVEISSSTVENLACHTSLSSTKRAARGSKGISRYGQKLIRNAGHRIQQRWGKERVAFLTLTLPNLSDLQYQEVVEGWSGIVKVFCQWLKRRLLKSFLPPFWVGCSEIQEKRLEKDPRPFPHLHLAYVGRHRHGAWCIGYLALRKAWKRAINTRLSHPLDSADVASVERVEKVEKSVADYLGKYMSKGTQVLHEVVLLSGKNFRLSAWFTISDKLRALILSERIKGNGEVFNFLSELAQSDCKGVFTWLKRVDIVDGDLKIPWGWCGKLTSWGMQLIRDFIQQKYS